MTGSIDCLLVAYWAFVYFLSVNAQPHFSHLKLHDLSSCCCIVRILIDSAQSYWMSLYIFFLLFKTYRFDFSLHFILFLLWIEHFVSYKLLSLEVVCDSAMARLDRNLISISNGCVQTGLLILILFSSLKSAPATVVFIFKTRPFFHLSGKQTKIKQIIFTLLSLPYSTYSH